LAAARSAKFLENIAAFISLFSQDENQIELKRAEAL
jgi:hypothetical protein